MQDFVSPELFPSSWSLCPQGEPSRLLQLDSMAQAVAGTRQCLDGAMNWLPLPVLSSSSPSVGLGPCF